jgi:Xaa-Pro dipeptidase
MAEHGIAKETVALDCCTSELLYEEAFKEKGMKVVDGKGVMFEARMIKNQDEIECVRMACSNAEAAFAAIQETIRPGVTEGDIMAAGMNALYRLGADETAEFVVASGFRTNPLHVDYTDRQVRPGDIVIVDVNGNCWQGYKSCYYRTFSCGKATQEQKDRYEECRKMMYDGMAGIKAGNTTWDICKNWPDSPGYWGYDNWDDVMALAVGHGIGISLHEVPFFTYPSSKANPVKLEEGMVLAVENWTGERDGKFGIRLEENIAVTKDGYDLLTLYPVDEIIECWT